MGRKAGISPADVIEAAAAIADRDGLAAATLTSVAQHLGIRTPSLYNHIDGLSGLRRLLALRAATMLSEAFTAAADGLDGPAKLRAIAVAYRTFALRHPGLYASLLPAPRPGEDDELYRAMAAPALMVADTLTEAGADHDTAIHLTRALRSLLHGFVHLESHGGFGMPVDIDASFDTALTMVMAATELTAGGDPA
jgi:AcrR family transcriptional regulator